jgi:hypothetical protein
MNEWDPCLVNTSMICFQQHYFVDEILTLHNIIPNDKDLSVPKSRNNECQVKILVWTGIFIKHATQDKNIINKTINSFNYFT